MKLSGIDFIEAKCAAYMPRMGSGYPDLAHLQKDRVLSILYDCESHNTLKL